MTESKTEASPKLNISTHTPAGGVTDRHDYVWADKDFYSHARGGRDRRTKNMTNYTIISTHTPAGGVTKVISMSYT